MLIYKTFINKDYSYMFIRYVLCHKSLNIFTNFMMGNKKKTKTEIDSFFYFNDFIKKL